MTNSFALITGASSGMGYCYAQQLAARGYQLLIVSNEPAIHEKAAILRNEYSVQVVSLERDLSLPSAAQELHQYCIDNQLEVEVLVNNAGVYHDRDFLLDSERFNSLILNLHMYTPAMLCYYFGQDMVARHKGYILNVCSITSTIAVQRLATYSATKAFLSNFSRALHVELRQKGVIVTDISPGAVDTGLYHIHPIFTKMGRALGIIVSPEYLVKRALNALFRGRAKATVPFVWSKLIQLFVALIPTCLLRLIRRCGY
ncbi:MAG: SDR family NAD(P)-dependent oxidoreductase [Bacteroidales bacterium]|nr:SDR family NAD(P)-dependent oxidoreductase [Bacteroidales bacterium]